MNLTIAADFALLHSSNLLATSEKSQRRVLYDPAQHKLFDSQFFTVEYHIVVFHNLYMSTFPDAHTANSRTVGTERCLFYSSELAHSIHLNTGSHSAFQDGLKLMAIRLPHAGIAGICPHAQILVQLVPQSESLVPSSSKLTSLHWVLNTNWIQPMVEQRTKQQ